MTADDQSRADTIREAFDRLLRAGFLAGAILDALLAENQRYEKALDDLFVWVQRMPDAGFNSESPRWEWWHEGITARSQAREALAGDGE